MSDETRNGPDGGGNENQSENDRQIQRDPAEAFRLRPERPRVMRLSRKVLAALAGVSGLTIMGALIWALGSGRRNAEPSQELFNTSNKPTADSLAALPKDYTGIPQLGPPLPGDLGRPILNAHSAVPPASGFDTAEQRIAQESEAARTSHVFVATTTRERPESTPAPASAPSSPQLSPSLVADQKPPLDPGSLQNMQDRKLAFLNGSTDRRTVSPDRLENPASAYIVQAGTVIPAALVTGIRSDLPGEITAQVTENVFDSPTGRFLLIPQGAKLIGTYDSQVSFGQSRVLLVWDRVIFPNGKSIVLEHQSGADPEGYAGLEDGVDYHWFSLLKAAALSTLLGVGSEIGATGTENDIIQALRRGSQDTLNQTGQELVRREMNIQPTLTIRPGFPVRVIVNRDLVLAPYQG